VTLEICASQKDAWIAWVKKIFSVSGCINVSEGLDGKMLRGSVSYAEVSFSRVFRVISFLFSPS